MRVGIDVRIDHSGIGRYTMSLVDELVGLDDGTEYVLFARAETYRKLERLGHAVERRLADVRWYSLAEQVLLPRMIRSAGVDIVHFPHFNVPLAFRGRYVVTIHDLTHMLRGGLEESSSDPARRWWRSAPYRLVVRQAVRRAAHVIAVSKATRHAIISRLGVDPGRVTVTHEGVDTRLLGHPSPDALARLGIEGDYFLVVGNAYPHKNLPRLLEAFARFRACGFDHALVLAGDHGRYGSSLVRLAGELGLGGVVHFTGVVTDEDLSALYRGATALVFVSLSEGFGLPGLEAMALGVPVLAARISSLTEIYGEAALFVDPTDTAEISHGLAALAADAQLRGRLCKLGRVRNARFSWRDTAVTTRRIYEECAGGCLEGHVDAAGG